MKKDKEKNLVPLNQIEGTDHNPFIVELRGRMYLQPRANTIVAKGEEIVDTVTGVVLSDDVLIGRRRVVDKSQFAKLYASEISILFDLTRPAVNVFIHLTKVMDYDNKALFDYNREFSKLGYKTNVQPLKGLRELIEKEIIYPHRISGVWWLNPTLVCKGERFAKYTEFVTQERHEKDYKKHLNNKMQKEQAQVWYDSIDEKTQAQLKAMNEAEEDRFAREYEKERNKELLDAYEDLTY